MLESGGYKKSVLTTEDENKNPPPRQARRGKQRYKTVKTYFLREARFAAFRGLTLMVTAVISGFAWVAKLHIPNFHFAWGVVYERQYFVDLTSIILSQPSHCSITGLKEPLVYNSESTAAPVFFFLVFSVALAIANSLISKSMMSII
jgi:hypothetical protein